VLLHLDAIIPAYNEEQTIAPVVLAVRQSRAFRHVLVVDDGSQDRTADAARSVGAAVLRLGKNRGKGGAMQAAVAALPGDRMPVAFFDADLKGFGPHHAALLAQEFRRTNASQVVGMRDHWGPLAACASLLMPIISGERVVQRWVLEALPLDCWNGYAIETAINHTVDRHGGTTVLVPMKGVQIRGKVGKVGWLDGMRAHMKMFRQMEKTHEALRGSGGATCGTDH
jgi:glycosyltransferase involved in cell wall biosynthesis